MIRLSTLGMILLLLLYSRPSLAQGENNVWCFGHQVGMDFNNTPPTFFQHSMKVIEGCASVSDASGNLLFYTSGNTCWNANGTAMPNGTGMHGNGPYIPPPANMMMGSSMMGVAVAQSPVNASQYFVFTTNAVDEDTNNVYYFVVDMSLNGGLGDVIPTQKNILLATDIMEGVFILENKDCGGFWIIVHKMTGNNYLAFKLDNTGIHTTPVTSTGITSGSTPWGNMGYMSYSRRHNLLARGVDTVELLSFNHATGALTPTGFLQAEQVMGIQFSPDASQLYISTQENLQQFHSALLPNIPAVQSSMQVIDTGLAFGMRNGPDGKLYLLRTQLHTISIINNPDASGTACNYVRNSMTIPGTANGIYSEFGSDLAKFSLADTLSNAPNDTLVCQADQATLHAPGNYSNYLWSNGGTTRDKVVSQDGMYWVSSIENCILHVDSFRVRFIHNIVDLGKDTAICPGTELVLDAHTGISGATYLWQDGSNTPTYTVTGQGVYSVTVNIGPCKDQDTLIVDVIDAYLHLAEQDTAVCPGTVVTLHAEASPAATYLWNNGASTPVIHTDSPGVYIVTATTICGTFSDSVRIVNEDCNCIAYAPNAFSPNGDGHNDLFVIELYCPRIASYSQTIYNRYGQKVFESKQPGEFWNGMFKGKACDVGTYFYYIEYKNGDEKIRKKGDLVLVR